MRSGKADGRSGKLKVLAGPDALIRLMERASTECTVTVGDGVLLWASDTFPTSPGGTIQGDRIESVTQHDATFVVNLKSSGNGIRALTFGATSKDDATAWVQAVEAITGAASAGPSQPTAEGTGAAPSPDPTPVRLKYEVDDKTIEKDYALLVIACDPRALIGICDYSEEEVKTFGQFSCYTFHVTLMKVKVPAQPQEHAVVFAPSCLERLDGSVYAYRNESAKQFSLSAANGMTENLVVVYQLAASSLAEEQFKKLLSDQLKTSLWWPFGQDYEIRESLTTPYFDHFGNSSLKETWTILQRQGQKHTLLVHASTCFESVLHCWSYGNLLESVPAAKQSLPKNFAAPIVVLGAGVSGILFAAKLSWMGYTNIDILENSKRFGGKTHSIIEDGPYPPHSQEKTVCELGTCYLSPAYATMVDSLKQHGVLDDNHQINFGEGERGFRGFVTAGEFSPDFKVPPVMDFSKYVILKAEDELGWSDSWCNKISVQLEIGYDLAKYSLLHIEYMGWDMPMPLEPPPDELFKQTFEDFLRARGLLSLIGLLQYGHEVQGYGPLKNIPAYYGLVWITPAITWTILMDSLGENTPVVTAWSKGWGNVWDQIVEKLKLNITYRAQTTSIKRS